MHSIINIFREKLSYYKGIYINTGIRIFFIKIFQFIKLQILRQPDFIFNKIFRPAYKFSCPICDYKGHFFSDFSNTGKRRNARCPGCDALERHRLQYLVLNEIFEKMNTEKQSMLHFAPEDFFKELLKNKFKNYITADLHVENADLKEDLTCLSFDDSTFDIIFASHVLQYIKNDSMALSEIMRVLKPRGIAIIPVPILSKKTVEYGLANHYESEGHVRCPGKDYYKRYRDYFNSVKLYTSKDFNKKYQLYVYENRTKWPKTMPLRPTTPGVKHIDIVPVCYK